MNNHVVVQSCAEPAPPWLSSLMELTRSRATECGLGYERIPDAEFLSLAPTSVSAKVTESILPVTDIARLLLIDEMHSAGAERVTWIDADVVHLRPLHHATALEPYPLALTHETWIQELADGRATVNYRVNNSFTSASRSRAFTHLIEETLSAADIEVGPLGKCDLGTYLLTRLHQRNAFRLNLHIANLSPLLKRSSEDSPTTVDMFIRALPARVDAVNIGSSSVDENSEVGPLDEPITNLLLERLRLVTTETR